MGQWVCGGSTTAPLRPPAKVPRGGNVVPRSSASAGGSFGTRHRTSAHATFRLRCAERNNVQLDKACPVKLVVFDLDETLTMATFMTSDGSCQTHERETMVKVNFESPWVEGRRVDKLRKMFLELKRGTDGRQRTLAILTRNANASGVIAVVNLLKVANLEDHFSAVWTMPWRRGKHNGAYQDETGTWTYFNPPIDTVHDHKADVLRHVAEFPEKWFPQLKNPSKAQGNLADLAPLKPESIVLVDDQRANFQSDTGASTARYCKVARYDATYRSFGFIKDMGGIGAHSDADYDTLRRFVEDPWMCKETYQVRCNEREFEGRERHTPPQLVVFDFDETLTLATFMPANAYALCKIGWKPASGDEWTEDDLRTYNFESPWVEGSRVEKLRKFLGEVARERKLAILTRNESGVVAVVNLLRIARLAEYFVAIWTMPHKKVEGQPGQSGAYQQGGQWKCFKPPIDQVFDHKASVLRHVVEHPQEWFPQLAGPEREQLGELMQLRPEGVVLIDDERANFRSYNSEGEHDRVLRYCKVARYDDTYRGCGPLNQMGGIGAHSDEDYESIMAFLRAPWDYPYERTVPTNFTRQTSAQMEEDMQVQREALSEELPKAPRKRSSFLH